MPATRNSADHNLLMRLWLSAPDWVFRTIGISFCLLFFLDRAGKYWNTPFSELGLPDLLADATFLWLAFSYATRVAPFSRAKNGWVILFSLVAAFLPLIVIMLQRFLGLFDTDWQHAYASFLWRAEISKEGAIIGGILITAGNVIDLWGYVILRRSFSIVPEPRELKTSGPYRFVRHPIYFGQFLSQGGIWLFFAQLHVVWIGFYIVFVAMQLYRSKLEDHVLADAFGEEYLQWQKKTFWFV